MKKLLVFLLFPILVVPVLAKCDLCNNPDLMTLQTPECIDLCSGGTLSDNCKSILCTEYLDMLSPECQAQYCGKTSIDLETRVSALAIDNKNEHDKINIQINNLRTEVNNIKSKNKQLQDRVNDIQQGLDEMHSPLKQNLFLYILLATISAGLFVLGFANKQQIKAMMPKKQLLTPQQKAQLQNYIQAYSGSYPKDRIYQGLRQQGWTDAQINEAYS